MRNFISSIDPLLQNGDGYIPYIRQYKTRTEMSRRSRIEHRASSIEFGTLVASDLFLHR